MQDIAEHLPITEGVDRLMYVLKKYGYKIAFFPVVFTYFGQYLHKNMVLTTYMPMNWKLWMVS